jgi:hypothetical protein
LKWDVLWNWIKKNKNPNNLTDHIFFFLVII